MSEDLTALLNNTEPLDEDDPHYHALLSDLQCNILSGHGRKAARYYFLRFADPIKAKYLCGMLPRTSIERAMVFMTVVKQILEKLPEETREKLGNQGLPSGPWLLSKEEYERLEGFLLTSEKAVRRNNKNRKACDDPSDFAVNLLLTHRGYKKLTDEPPPSDPAFGQGMAARSAKLNDPEPQHSDEKRVPADQKPALADEEQLVAGADALLIVAYDPCVDGSNGERQNGALTTLETALKEHVGLIGKPQVGQVLTVELGAISLDVKEDDKGKRVAIEPFGFRDGISQPAFYASDIAEMERRGVIRPPSTTPPAEREQATARARRAAFAPLSLALCPDPNGKSRHACGSYFVFRKLGQDIEKFYGQVATLAEETKRDVEDVLADLVGRRRDGTPLAAEKGAGTDTFDYRDDDEGVRCPFHAHVRKVNPRGDIGHHAREQRIVRHGMPYGPAIVRDVTGKPQLTDGKVTREGGDEVKRRAVKPNEIGLLFLCAQSSIEKQFERIQMDWANNALFPWGKAPGADTIIGQRARTEKNHIRISRKQAGVDELEFAYERVVSPCGGDYFFAPSISFLRGLHDGLWK